MIFAKGALLPDEKLPQVLAALEGDINAARANLTLPPETVISALEQLTALLDSGALNELLAQFATAEMLKALEDIRPSLTRQALETRLEVEVGPMERKQPFGKTVARPLGTLFHVTAGNVAALPAFSAIEGLLTGNVNLIKLPRGDKGLTTAILSKLVEVEPQLVPFLYAFDVPSSDRETMQALANLADGLVVWGGDEAVGACRALARPGCKLMEWGHRLSFCYLAGWDSEDAEQADLTALARHILDTGGLLCSSCQVIFLDTSSLKLGELFCEQFLPILTAQASLPAPIGSQGMQTLYGYEAWLEHIVDHPHRDEKFYPGRGCSITLCKDDSLELSPLNGNVLVKCLPREKLVEVLRREKGHLQTAGLCCTPADRPVLTDLLARAGVTRITRPGDMSASFPLENHDGEYSLRRYIRFVDIQED